MTLPQSFVKISFRAIQKTFYSGKFVFRRRQMIFRVIHEAFRSVQIIFRSRQMVFWGVQKVFLDVQIIFRSIQLSFRDINLLFLIRHSTFRYLHLIFSGDKLIFLNCQIVLSNKQNTFILYRCSFKSHKSYFCPFKQKIHFQKLILWKIHEVLNNSLFRKKIKSVCLQRGNFT